MNRCFYLSILLVLTLCITLIGCSKPPLTYDEQISLGNKYLSEGNYKEAILAFEAAIIIDPKSIPAYLGIADSYIGLGDELSAVAVLQKGFDITQSDVLGLRIEQMSGEASDIVTENTTESITDSIGPDSNSNTVTESSNTNFADMPTFIDIVGGAFNISNGNFEGEIHLMELPSELTFNNPQVDIDANEYAWLINLVTDSSEYQIGVMAFKFEQNTVKTGILESCQSDIWKKEGTFKRVGAISTTINESKILISGSLGDSLNFSDIKNIKLTSYYDDGTNIYQDEFSLK